MLVVLKPHPSSVSTAVDRIEVDVERIGEGGLKLTWRAFGDLGRVLLPEFVDHPGRTDELWRHTCFEAFLQPVGGEGYVEFNFATSLQWATYRFDGYREGMRDASIQPWAMQGHIPPRGLELSVDLAPGRFARPDLPAPDWRLGVTAVIEDVKGGISYWALNHPSDRPDFHNALSFTLVLPASDPSQETQP